MHGDMLANNGVIADATICLRAGVSSVLRPIADDGPRMHAAPAAKRRVSQNMHMGRKPAARCNAHRTFHDDVRADVYGGIKLGEGINDSGDMNGQINIRAVCQVPSRLEEFRCMGSRRK